MSLILTTINPKRATACLPIGETAAFPRLIREPAGRQLSMCALSEGPSFLRELASRVRFLVRRLLRPEAGFIEGGCGIRGFESKNHRRPRRPVECRLRDRILAWYLEANVSPGAVRG